MIQLFICFIFPLSFKMAVLYLIVSSFNSQFISWKKKVERKRGKKLPQFILNWTWKEQQETNLRDFSVNKNIIKNACWGRDDISPPPRPRSGRVAAEVWRWGPEEACHLSILWTITAALWEWTKAPKKKKERERGRDRSSLPSLLQVSSMIKFALQTAGAC